MALELLEYKRLRDERRQQRRMARQRQAAETPNGLVTQSSNAAREPESDHIAVEEPDAPRHVKHP
eukprot:CAMPEP_0172753786 /NCGR_PEP_ID=MMETSP1074-20121228/156680_1 /TAXON_ID=2916 /ORGANISM="Ceratium fusus, Strain PA161109" /LENGTH=64 /DNA_ID=CAMNT_0013586549 /DNA_START=16 /DNA_END=206 /DNA_ORIENTATION=+